MSVTVGILTIDLKANTASFSQSMDKMSSLSAKTANDIKRSLEKIAVAGVAMAGAMITATTATIVGALDAADALGKFAASAGTTSETLSVLKYAAGLSNVGTEALVKGLEKLSVAAFKAQNGNVQLERIFQRVGVSATDSNGKIKDSGLLMEELAVKFSKMGTSGGKTALVMALFGKAGGQLIPLLNQLGEEQAKVNEEAHRFGLVLSTSTTDVAEKAHDNIDRLHLMLKGLGYSLLGSVLPALDKLLERLIDIATKANIPDLAKSFGAKVTTAINLLGDALEFAVTHVKLLEAALVSLASIQVAKIAIPVIGDLIGGGGSKVGEGVAKMMLGFAGLSKVGPQIMQFSKWVIGTTQAVASLAMTEGVAATATYIFGGALAVVSAPAVLITGAVLAATAAIAGLAIAAYKFRDATFSLGDTTYKLRDIWHANWIAMGWELTWIKDHFNTMVSALKSIWAGFTAWLSQNTIAKFILGDLQGANDRLDGYVGKFVNTLIERLKGANERLNVYLTPKFVVKALDQAKAERETSRFLKLSATDITPPTITKKKKSDGAPDTSGLGKQTESPVDKVLANLQEKLDESKQTLAAAGLEEEAQRKVAAANKASNEIMKLGQEIAKQTGAKTKDYASLVDEATQALIREKNAQISDIEAKTTLLNLLGTTSRASALSIAQAGLMVEAMDKGSEAVMRQTAMTQAWNELRAKGASLTQMLARSQEIYAEAVAKESQAIHGNIISMQQELAVRRMVDDATLGSLAVQDEAALNAKLYALDVQIAGSAAGELRDKLLAQRDAMVALNEEEKRAADLRDARALQSPETQYALEQEHLAGVVEALRNMQGGTVSYGQSLQIAMKEQENFNRLVDETVKSLLFQGNAASGMKAFFLDMQKSAITAAQVIYEALHQAFTKISDNLTQLITGGKTNFAQMFQDIGRQMVNSTIQSGLQKGLGALGKILPASIGGPLTDALKGKPDGSRTNPFHVIAEGGGLGGGSQSNPLSAVLGAAGGIGGIGGKAGALGVGTGVMGTGVTSLGDLFGGKGGDVSGLAVRSPTDLLGGWSPGDGEGGGGLGDAITGIGPDQNDSEGGGGVAVAGIGGGLLSMIGGIFGGGNKGKPDGSKNNPLFVQANGGLGGSGGGILDALGGGSTDQARNDVGGSSKLSGVFGFLGSLFSKGKSSSGDSGGGSDGGGGSVWGQLLKTVIGAFMPHAEGGPISGPGTGTSDSIPARLSNGEFVVRAAPAAKFKGLLQHINKGGNVHKTPAFAAGGFVGFADGGPVTSPSSAYSTSSPSTMAAASGQIAGNTSARRLMSANTGPNLYYTIDARGTDPVLTEQRTRTAILAAHNSAISNAVQVNAERLKRTPQR